MYACQKIDGCCVSCLCVVGTAFVSLLWQGHVWMPVPETLCECCV